MVIRTDLHTNAENYYRKKFNGKKDEKQKYGDFCIPYCNSIIGFEVYAPEEPLSRSTIKMKKNTLTTKLVENKKVARISGGLDPDRFNQLIYRIFDVKCHQFKENINFPKVLIVCCKYPGGFTGLDNFNISGNIDFKLFNKWCSGIIVDGHYETTVVSNPNAKYPLEASVWKELFNNLAKVKNVRSFKC